MIKINKRIIKSSKIDATTKIVLIADIHLWDNYNEQLIDNLIKNLLKIKPNFICICGDIIDEFRYLNNEENEKHLLKILNTIAHIAPTFISLGSHDFLNAKKHKTDNLSFRSLRYWQKMIKANANPNLNLLHNSIYEYNNFRIIGYTPSQKYYGCNESTKILTKELNQAFPNKYYDNKFNILMIHSPQRITTDLLSKLKINQNIDLILSGHMHDGLVFPLLKKLPSNIGFVSPQRKFFPDNTRGIKKIIINNKTIYLIITGGLLKFSHMSPKVFHKLNFLYHSDIDYIILKKEK